jgi:carbon starvation protein
VGGWGWFLYQGVTDPLGGINTLWPLFGIANQMLAGMALIFACVALVKMKRDRWLWVVALPTAWLIVCTLTAGWLKLFSADAKIGFFANAQRFAQAMAEGKILAPAKSLEEMQRVIGNQYINATLCALFMAVVVAMLFFGIRAASIARRNDRSTAQETPYVALATVEP